MLKVKTIHNPRYERLIECLIDARKSQHLTQVQLADELDKPQSYIAKIEGRERKIDIIEKLYSQAQISQHLSDMCNFNK